MNEQFLKHQYMYIAGEGMCYVVHNFWHSIEVLSY